MKKILVTGGTGLVGTYLKKILPDATYVSSKDYNLLDKKEVQRMFTDIKPRKIIHLAARVGGVHHNIQEPVKYFEENLLMNTFVLQESFLNNVESFLGILSSCIYPNDVKSYPIKEENLLQGAPHQDLFSYSYAKRCLAIQIDAYNKKYNTKYNYLIPCNLYGEYDKFDPIEGHFVGALIEKIINAKKSRSKSIEIFGDGTPYRQFMHARDLAQIIKMTILKNIFLSFNVATDENYTIKKIVEIALEACNIQNLNIYFDKSKPNGQLRKDIDITNLKKLFPDFTPINLIDGIKEIYNKKNR